MLILDKVIGHATDHDMAERLHDISHHGVIEYLMLSKDDVLRHRLRINTDKGTECAIQISRNEHLANGAVMLLDETRAIVIKMLKIEWLSLKPKNAAAALELGYFAGNMHWKVDFEEDVLRITLNGPKDRYVERLSQLIKDGKIELIHD